MELYEEARRGGDTKAASNLGGLCDQKGDLPVAMELYEEARRGRDTRAGLQLAVPSSGNLCSCAASCPSSSTCRAKQ